MYQKKRNIQKRQNFMLPAGFEPTIPASEQPQIHALEPTATKIEVTRSQSSNFPIYMEFPNDA
jgi:hypothetical protein